MSGAGLDVETLVPFWLWNLGHGNPIHGIKAMPPSAGGATLQGGDVHDDNIVNHTQVLTDLWTGRRTGRRVGSNRLLPVKANNNRNGKPH